MPSLFPEFLYYTDVVKCKNVSPAARLNPTSALSGNAWQNSTAPSQKLQNKILLIDEDFFKKPPLQLDESLALIARLKDAGFKIYLKNVIGNVREVQSDMKALSDTFPHLSKFNESDYASLADCGVEKDKTIILDAKQRKEIEKSITEDKIGKPYSTRDNLRYEFRLLSADVQDEMLAMSVDLEAFMLAKYSSPDFVKELILNHKHLIKEPENAVECLILLKGTDHEGEIEELFRGLKDKINGEVLAGCLEALKGTKHEDRILSILNEFKEKITSFGDLGKCLRALKGGRYEDGMMSLLKENRARIRISNLPSILKILKGSMYEGKMGKLFEEFKDGDNFYSTLIAIECIEAFKGTKHEDKIKWLLDKYINENNFPKYMSALKGTQYAGEIIKIFERFKDKIDEHNFFQCIEALKGTQYKGEITELWEKFKDKIDQHNCFQCIEALKGTKHEDEIGWLLEKFKYMLRSYGGVKCIESLKGSQYEDRILEIILKVPPDDQEIILYVLPRKMQNIVFAINPKHLSFYAEDKHLNIDHADMHFAPTHLHIARLESREQVKMLLSKKSELSNIAVITIVHTDDPDLLKDLIEGLNLPNLRYLSLPEGMRKHEINFGDTLIGYEDYGIYEDIEHRWNNLSTLEHKDEPDIRKPKPKDNIIFIGSGGVSESIDTSSKEVKFNMRNAGKVLNDSKIEPEIRGSIVEYDDITKGLEQYEYIPSKFKDVEHTVITEDDIDGYKGMDSSKGVFYRFNQNIKSGIKHRLLSAAASEELVGVLATDGAKIKILRGDDDFFYVQSDKDCTLSHVTKAPKIQEFELLSDKHPVKEVINEYTSKKKGDEECPHYESENHAEWLKKVFSEASGACRHKVAAVTYALLDRKKVKADDIRTVRINGNHVKLEMKYKGKWFFVRELGGVESGLEYDENATYSPPKVKERSKEELEQKRGGDVKDTVLLQGDVEQIDLSFIQPSESLLEAISTTDKLIEGTTRSNKKKIFVKCGGKRDINQCANFLLEDAVSQGRKVYYIDSPKKIDLDRKTAIIHQDEEGELSVDIKPDGPFADFIDSFQDGDLLPLLLINDSSFTSKQRLRLNTMLDNNRPTIHGRDLPLMQIVGLYEKEPTDRSLLSRYDSHIEFNGRVSDGITIDVKKPLEVIDLEGLANWKEALFGSVILQDGEMIWCKSNFVNMLKNADNHFELINLSKEAIKEFEYEYNQAKSVGYFTYNGFNISLPRNVKIECGKRGFDFTQFENHDIRSDDFDPDVKIINGSLFDQLLHGKKIEEGVYTQTPGLIEESANGNLKLFITSSLSDAQWYCLFNQAKKYNVSLELYTAPNVQIPRGLSLSSLEEKKEAIQIKESSPNLPNIYVSNNTDELVKELQKDDAIVIDIEDYTYGDLVSSTDFTIGEDSFSDFKKVKSDIITRLENDDDVILKGEFSPELLQMLHPLLTAQGEFSKVGNNLTLIIEGQSDKSLEWLPNYQTKQYEAQPVVQQVVYKEDCDKSFDLTESVQKSNEFILNRKYQFEEFLANHSMLQLIGHSGVGKSRLLKMFEQEEYTDTVKVYRELNQLDSWASDKSKKRKILFIDESNIEDLHFTMFSPLKPGGNKKMLYKGKIYELGENHKVVFAGNPKEYGGGRHDQKLFEDHSIPQMHMEDFPACYTYEKILKGAIYDKLNPEIKDIIKEDEFKEICKSLIESYYEHNEASDKKITVRELQEKALGKLLDRYYAVDITELKTKNFISTKATQESQRALDRSILIRQKQRQGAFPDEAVGVNGVLLEGDPGLGKTEMIIAMLEAKGVHKATTELEQSGEQLYYKIDASQPLEKKKEIINKAFENGHIIWIDEINSCIDDGLEKVLNSALTGAHPDTGKKAKTPGFMMVASMNPISMEGRSAISPALLHRLTHKKMKPLKEYEIDDITKIVDLWTKDNPEVKKIRDCTRGIAKIILSILESPEHKSLHNLRSLKKKMPEFIDRMLEVGEHLSRSSFTNDDHLPEEKKMDNLDCNNLFNQIVEVKDKDLEEELTERQKKQISKAAKLITKVARKIAKKDEGKGFDESKGIKKKEFISIVEKNICRVLENSCKSDHSLPNYIINLGEKGIKKNHKNSLKEIASGILLQHTQDGNLLKNSKYKFAGIRQDKINLGIDNLANKKSRIPGNKPNPSQVIKTGIGDDALSH